MAKTDALTASVPKRDDMVYLDVWEREVNALEDNDLVDSRIGVETSVRTKREWVVRVKESFTGTLPAVPDGHVFYPLALLHRVNNLVTAEDERLTGISLAALEKEVTDARGMKANLGNRLDESLTKGGQLRQKVVGKEQFNDELAQNLFMATSYDFKNRSTADLIFTEGNANGALQTINTGFKPRFVWAVGSCNTTLGGNYCGANSSGYADLRTPFIQKCNGACIYRICKYSILATNGLYDRCVGKLSFLYVSSPMRASQRCIRLFWRWRWRVYLRTGVTVKLTWQGPSTTTLTLQADGQIQNKS